MHGLSRRVRELERQSGVDGKYISLPLPGTDGQFVRLPRPFAEWMAKVGQEDSSGGRYFNYTDGKWVETGDDDKIRHNPTK